MLSHQSYKRRFGGPSQQSWPEGKSSKAAEMLHFMVDKFSSCSQINGTGKQNRTLFFLFFYWAGLFRKCFIDPRDERCDCKRFSLWGAEEEEVSPTYVRASAVRKHCSVLDILLYFPYFKLLTVLTEYKPIRWQGKTSTSPGGEWCVLFLNSCSHLNFS